MAKILSLHDPLENLKSLDSSQGEELINKAPARWLSRYRIWKQEEQDDEAKKFCRILSGNGIQICDDLSLYGSNDEGGIYEKISLINHSCIPNVVWSWVLGDFQRKQVRALKNIEKGEEILAMYHSSNEFCYGSREFRRQELLDGFGFLCQCTECSLRGEALEENERKRTDIREKSVKIRLLLKPGLRSPMESAMKLCQKILELIKDLDIRSMIVIELTNTACIASKAKMMGISVPDPNMFRQEALEYAKKFGDLQMNL